MNKSEGYIENESFVVVNPDCPVIAKENALKAFKIAKEEMKQKATEAFRLLVSRYCAKSGRNDISEGSEYYVKVFNELINS